MCGSCLGPFLKPIYQPNHAITYERNVPTAKTLRAALLLRPYGPNNNPHTLVNFLFSEKTDVEIGRRSVHTVAVSTATAARLLAGIQYTTLALHRQVQRKPLPSVYIVVNSTATTLIIFMQVVKYYSKRVGETLPRLVLRPSCIFQWASENETTALSCSFKLRRAQPQPSLNIVIGRRALYYEDC